MFIKNKIERTLKYVLLQLNYNNYFLQNRVLIHSKLILYNNT